MLVVAREGLGSRSVALQWTTGATWGGPITFYTVQASTNHNGTWVTLKGGEFLCIKCGTCRAPSATGSPQDELSIYS